MANDQFAYQDERNRDAQDRLEIEFTNHLRDIGAWLPQSDFQTIDVDAGDFPVECSVIIPVRNRETTIADAVSSALSQEAFFPFNVIVVDNHSTDHTSDILRRTADADPRLIYIVPEQIDLGIGGCWDLAVNDPRCGRFAVQLDSDDLYADSHVLETIVEAMRHQKVAMLVGSYRLTDFNLDTIPPGIIAHREWSDENGPNNLLRVNGIGAPRAFYTPVVRQIGFKNVSYGEDYAMALRISSQYRVARIYDVLYICRRWEGNSDAEISPQRLAEFNSIKDGFRSEEVSRRIALNINRGRIERVNPATLETLFSHQLALSPSFVQAYEAIAKAPQKTFTIDGNSYIVRLLERRAGSTLADLSPEAIAKRRCFLCPANRPAEQKLIRYGRYDVLVNPYPICSRHFTVVAREHIPQAMSPRVADEMARLAALTPGYSVFFNSAGAGASAPDHLHFQVVDNQLIETPTAPVVFDSESPADIADAIIKNIAALSSRVFNLMIVNQGPRLRLLLWPRKCHRATDFPTTGISPASLELARIITLSRRDHFDAVTPESISSTLAEVTAPAQPPISVGVASEPALSIRFSGPFNGKESILPIHVTAADLAEPMVFLPDNPAECSFTIEQVGFGLGFHWERKEDMTYHGALRLVANENKVLAINLLGVEDYLASVVSSEMSPDAPLEFVKAHAIISRSWVMNILRPTSEAPLPDDRIDTPDRRIAWRDRDDHSLFDVCSDDHCQRYQGVGRITNPTALRAVADTSGMVLTDTTGSIIDARFSKCCGGATEVFASCWQPVSKPGLEAFRDTLPERPLPDLTNPAEAAKWITSRPEAFCNTSDPELLAVVLNSFDRETPDFFRWTVTYTQSELSAIISRRLGKVSGRIRSLRPLQRGLSGRIVSLLIEAENFSLEIGKELEIRRVLSDTHLLSSAFIVETSTLTDGQGFPTTFTIRGAGWGHGVGLCQIGAASMASKGYNASEILSHYYPHSSLTRLY